MHQQNNPNKGIGTGRPPKTTIKFEGDYDFEQANNKFEELRLELAKLKVGDEAKPEQVDTLLLFVCLRFTIAWHGTASTFAVRSK